MGYKSGFGLVPDGEDLERIWAEVLPHVGPTTQMLAANREDTLALAFRHVLAHKSLGLPRKVRARRIYAYISVYLYLYTCLLYTSPSPRD